MLRRVSDLQRFTVAAADGNLGNVRDLWFDDRSWTVRYLVVDVGNWLPGRWGLVPPISVQMSDPDPRTFRVALSKMQVTTSPDIGASRMLPASPPQGGSGAPHLQTATAIIGYAVETEDGEIGHVADALVDDKVWAIRYLVVDPEHRWRGKKVLVSPAWLTPVTWDESRKLSCIVTAVER
jgi:sporulation protein YlmC with PRC-barrel domain